MISRLSHFLPVEPVRPSPTSDPDQPAALPAAGPYLASLLPRAELAAAGLLSLLALFLHVHLYLQGQPLWRDEVNLLQMATLPTWADTWKYLPFDSCPALSHGMVRDWVALFPADRDFQLRLLGLLIGTGGLAAMWLSVRAMGARVPLLSVVLLGFNPLFIRYGDSARAYGLGILFALLTLTVIWRLVEKVSPGRVLLAVAVGVLSVHALFYNAVLLFTICISGALVTAWEREWKKAAVVLAVGLPAAVSLLPYAAMIHEQHRWSFLLYYPVTATWLWERLSQVTGSPDPVGVWVWTGLTLGLVGWVAGRLFHRRAVGDGSVPARERAIRFALLSLVTGCFGYGVFLEVLNYPTEPWYYLVILALVAACLDVIGAGLVERESRVALLWRIARLAFAFGFTALVFLQAQHALLARPTNVDAVAKTLEESAVKDDLIVHLRWECAISFGHYYTGAAPQETLPPLTDHRFHRYDLVLQAMTTPDAIAPVLARMADTLRGGHRVWLVGTPLFLREGASPLVVQPPFQEPDRWHMGGDHYMAWQIQACHFLQTHVTSARPVLVSVDQPVIEYENLALSVFQGWKDAAPPTPPAAAPPMLVP